ncbi:MAG: hypothetical protein ACP5NF_02675 [Thermoanaerobaculum sp.]
MVTSPDEYLLEKARKAFQAEFQRLFPQGEMVVADPPWEVGRLCQEVQTPSLFAAERLILVPAASAYFALPPKACQALGAALKDPAPGVLWVGLFAELTEAPRGPLAAELEDLGEWDHLALPPPPKPWEDVKLSREQKSLLKELLAQEVPQLAEHEDVLDVLLETHGFSPRTLCQAAQGLVASQELTPEAARRTGGRPTLAFGDLEKALQQGDWPKIASALGQLAEGATLATFRGEEASGRRASDLVAGFLARACLQALTVRLLAERAGLAGELSPQKVAHPAWYPREFKPRIYPKLLAAAQETPELGLAERSPWSLHVSFRLAARFPKERLVAALGTLLRSGALRAEAADPWAAVVLSYGSFLAASKSS